MWNQLNAFRKAGRQQTGGRAGSSGTSSAFMAEPSISKKIILGLLALGLAAGASWAFQWYLGDTTSALASNASNVDLTRRIVHLLDWMFSKISPAVLTIVFFYMCYAEWRRKRICEAIKAAHQVNEEVLAEIKGARLDGIRMLPYGNKPNSYFFHAEPWPHRISDELAICDLTVDFIYDGHKFHAKNCVLSPTYLRYFFSRRMQTQTSTVSVAERSVRIIFVDPSGLQSPGHDQDLLVYLNLSALAGYATYVVPKNKYETFLPVLEARLVAKGINIPTAKLREFFEGHLSISAFKRNKCFQVQQAIYDKAPDEKGFKHGEVRPEVAAEIFDASLSFLCNRVARLPDLSQLSFDPARPDVLIMAAGDQMLDLHSLRNKLEGLEQTNFEQRATKIDWC